MDEADANPEFVLLVDCAARPGLVHAITGVLFRAGANVISNHEFVDAETQRFFMRTGCRGKLDSEGVREAISAVLPPAAAVQVRRVVPRRIVVLDKGGIVEEGSHDELVRRGGKYAHMFALQAEGYK